MHGHGKRPQLLLGRVHKEKKRLRQNIGFTKAGNRFLQISILLVAPFDSGGGTPINGWRKLKRERDLEIRVSLTKDGILGNLGFFCCELKLFAHRRLDVCERHSILVCRLSWLLHLPLAWTESRETSISNGTPRHPTTTRRPESSPPVLRAPAGPLAPLGIHAGLDGPNSPQAWGNIQKSLGSGRKENMAGNEGRT